MTGPGGGKISAQSYSAGSMPQPARGPLDWGNKCFLCTRTINIDTPPVEPREFYTSATGKMLLCHQKCLYEMQAAGGTPRDYYQARRAAGKQDIDPEVKAEPTKPAVVEQAGAWLAFGSLRDYNAHIAAHGAIEESVKVTVGDSVVQVGE